MPAREPVCAHLAEALRWMVAHSQASADGLTPGPLELAEVLWLARHLPEPPPRRKEPPQAPPPAPIDPEPQTRSPAPTPQTLKEESPSETSLPPDPFLPSPWPGDPAKPAPEDTLLPVAVLPDAQDVARALELEGMVLPGRVREEGPLGDRDKLLSALAPLLQRRPDPSRMRFDEERTVELYAQTRLLQPLQKPSLGPTFDEVRLVLDGGVSMQVWRPMAEELQRVLASTQVFRQVRLETLEPGPVVERAKDRTAFQRAVERLSGAARPLPGSSPLLLLLSDTAGRHWWDGRMFAVLEQWGRSCPTAILHPLPLWHWNRTALAAVERVTVHNSSPAAANRAYGADPLNWWQPPLPPRRDLPLPVLPLDREALAAWSAVVMGNPAFATAGVALLPLALREQRLRQLLGDRDLSAPSPAPERLRAEQALAQWEAFQAMASPEAQQLLEVMASSPLLTLPVMRLLQAAKLPVVASALPIAEVLTSGLVARKQERSNVPPDSRKPPAKPLRAEQIQFEVLPEVAAQLLERLPATERRDVISRVSALVERRWNSRYNGEPSFEAVLCDPTVSPPKGVESVVQFASVTARLLDTLPGDKARAFAERIRQGSGLAPGSPWPASMAFEEVEFEAAQLVAVPELQTISFTAARLVEVELRRIGFQTAKLQPDLTPRFSDGEAWAFHEPLQRDRLPFGAAAEKPDPLALTLVEIPAGEFLMGSPKEEEDSYDDERPQHPVQLQGFFMGQTPITQAQWREVAGWNEREGERWGRKLKPNPSRFQQHGDARLFQGETSTDGRPVEQVSWEDAMEFCSRLSQRTGRTYTLPSEAQWEYGCRAGTETPFAFGETITPELANYNGNSTYGKGPKGEFRKETTPVGMFPANAWGLQDMHGNVWEWCLDDWHFSYEGAPEDGSAWVSEEGLDRLLRGGSWFNDPRYCRSAFRSHIRPVDADFTIGFRVVCLPQGPSLNA